MSRIKDGSVNLNLNTMEEVSKADFALMDDYWQKDGWLAFKTNEFNGDEMPEINATVEGQVSPSKHLQKTLFALHMARGGKSETFNDFYLKTMAKITRDIQRLFPDSEG